jgi:hypothetical protein
LPRKRQLLRENQLERHPGVEISLNLHLFNEFMS